MATPLPASSQAPRSLVRGKSSARRRVGLLNLHPLVHLEADGHALARISSSAAFSSARQVLGRA
eukprot:9330783-Heterocapsa_arctica.AAC.1